MQINKKILLLAAYIVAIVTITIVYCDINGTLQDIKNNRVIINHITDSLTITETDIPE